ncbi:MAG: esterase/lipase family protein [Candidatus Heimdallarchaeota archaeon]
MSMQEKIAKRIGIVQKGTPVPPKIDNEDANKAQQELNKILNRNDINSNALPSNEGNILTIFLHGYIASKWLWIDPFYGTFGWLKDHKNEPKPRNYGWHQTPPPPHMFIPFDVSISPTVYPEGVFSTLMREGHEVLAYSQQDATGDIDISTKELEIIINGIKKIYGNRRLVLVGHSRGGICIRRYLDLYTNSEVEKIITLSTPHGGSQFTNIKMLKEPAKIFLNKSNIKGIWDASGNREVRDLFYEQMVPNSEFLLNLNDRQKSKGIEYITAGGTNAHYAHIYTWSVTQKVTRSLMTDIFSFQIKEKLQNVSGKIDRQCPVNKDESKEKKSMPKQFQWIAYPKRVMTLFEKIRAPEIRNGDGVVSLQSATLKDATRKYKIDANHEEIAVSDDTKKLLSKELKLTKNKK